MSVDRQEFAKAVAAAISSVQHLYREVDRLMEGLRSALVDDAPSLGLIRGTLGKSGRDQSRLIIRHEYGALFGAEAADEEDFDDEVDRDAEAEDEDEEAGSEGRAGGPAEIASDQALLAVRLVMYEPRKQEGFEPEIQYAVMTGWTVGKNASTQESRFLIDRYMLRRVPRALSGAGNLGKDGRLVTRAAVRRVSGGKKAADRKLACSLPAGLKSVPLYQLDSAGELDGLAKAMKTMWKKVADGS